MRTHNIKPDVISFNSAINACAKDNQTAAAMKLLSEMESCGVEPDIQTYNALISSCGKLNIVFVLKQKVFEMKTGS